MTCLALSGNLFFGSLQVDEKEEIKAAIWVLSGTYFGIARRYMRIKIISKRYQTQYLPEKSFVLFDDWISDSGETCVQQINTARLRCIFGYTVCAGYADLALYSPHKIDLSLKPMGYSQEHVKSFLMKFFYTPSAPYLLYKSEYNFNTIFLKN